METLIPREYSHEGKRYVDVIVDCGPDGSMTPLSFRWGSRTVPVDRLLECRREASLIAGGVGTRYICRVEGRRLSLWYEDGRWFVELRPGQSVPPAAVDPAGTRRSGPHRS